MSEHKLMECNQRSRDIDMPWSHWESFCSCGWRSGGNHKPDTAIEARAAYEDHVYSAVGREAVELHRRFDEGFYEELDAFEPLYTLVDAANAHRERVVAFLAAVDEALRKED